MSLALAQLALSMSLVGANVVIGKLLSAALPVPVILFGRCVLGTLLLAPLALRGAGGWPPPRLLGISLLQALAGVLGYNSFLLAGLRRTGALQAGLVLAALPAVTAIAAALFLRERLGRRRGIAIALAAAGLAGVAAARAGAGAAAPGAGEAVPWTGCALVLLAVCSEAAYMLLARVMAVRVPPLRATFLFQIAGMALMAPLALPLLAGSAPTLATPRVGGLLCLHAATASVLCNLLWFSGMRRAPASLAAVMSVFLPGTAAVLAVLLLGEQLTPALAAALVVMLASILVATWPARPTTAPPPVQPV